MFCHLGPLKEWHRSGWEMSWCSAWACALPSFIGCPELSSWIADDFLASFLIQTGEVWCDHPYVLEGFLTNMWCFCWSFVILINSHQMDLYLYIWHGDVFGWSQIGQVQTCSGNISSTCSFAVVNCAFCNWWVYVNDFMSVVLGAAQGERGFFFIILFVIWLLILMDLLVIQGYIPPCIPILLYLSVIKYLIFRPSPHRLSPPCRLLPIKVR